MKTIIEMAREAGLVYGSDNDPLPSVLKFAALVREDEREACAKVCEELGETKFIPSHDIYIVPPKPEECAAAIRARGEK